MTGDDDDPHRRPAADEGHPHTPDRGGDDRGMQGDAAPGDEEVGGEIDIASGIRGYAIGLVLAVGLSAVSFFMAKSTLVWTPSIPIALSVLAVAQMGVHLVFFLHLTTGKDNLNNVLALAFGLLIVMLVVFGSLWIMTHLNHMTMPMDQIMKMQR